MEYYFVKNEEIRIGEKTMILMDIRADNLYSFKNFHLNMSYPKKIVDSSVEEEHLQGYPNFRYKKVNIIMGGNATGKTSLGKMMMLFANYLRDGSINRFLSVIDEKGLAARLTIDFVADPISLYRFEIVIPAFFVDEPEGKRIESRIRYTKIGLRDNYETCAERLDLQECPVIDCQEIDALGWYFSYPQDAWKNKTYYSLEGDDRYLHILERILKSLDPSIREVIRLPELDNTYAIKLKNHSVVIKDGKINDTDILSSGTKAGLDISYVMASLVCGLHMLYYCDELFSYVNSDVEKACLSIMIDKLTEKRENKQLFFTTHNTEILDMQLPKHAFTFLRKTVEDEREPIKCICAAEYLKRNTDSLKHAVENDLFAISPRLDMLYEIAAF